MFSTTNGSQSHHELRVNKKYLLWIIDSLNKSLKHCSVGNKKLLTKKSVEYLIATGLRLRECSDVRFRRHITSPLRCPDFLQLRKIVSEIQTSIRKMEKPPWNHNEMETPNSPLLENTGGRKRRRCGGNTRKHLD